MIVVTGMHRSGTSLVANLLMELGVDFGDPDTFYRADDWNERGYFEQREVVDLNARLITGWRRAEAGPVERRLNQLRYLTMPGPHAIARRGLALREALAAFGAARARRAVKDPRFCLTLDAWRAATRVESVVVCLRDPQEVLDSLHRRQRVPRSLGFRFWDYHTARLLEATGPEPTLYLSYNALTGGEPTAELERAVAFFDLGLSPAEAQARFRGVFARDLYHCRSEAEDADLPERTRRLWDALRARWSADRP